VGEVALGTWLAGARDPPHSGPQSPGQGLDSPRSDPERSGAEGRGEDPAFSLFFFFFSSQLGRFNGAKELVKS
jgi:hypothetical protein